MRQASRKENMFEDINNNIGFELVLALGGFLMSMFLTPIYTNFAYKHKTWRRFGGYDNILELFAAIDCKDG